MGEREQAIRGLFDTSGLGLEIGPSYNPIVPKRDGYRVQSVDHATADQLRVKYANEGTVDASQIEEVDFVWDGRPLPELLGVVGHYDYVVASHVIEHTPDLLGFLLECDELLKPDGVLVLAVPDMRRCFDVLRPLTSTGQVLQAHLERRRRHLPGTAFDQVAYMVTRNGVAGWMEGTEGELAFVHSLETARSIFDRERQSDEYADFHAWVFTPSSFRLIIHDLNALGMLPCRERSFQTTPSVEFWVTLDRSGAGCSLDRMSLARAVHGDLREVT